jgi:hypothetical protein
MPCASPLSRHFVAPPALVCDPLLGILVVRITRCRGRSSLASGNNASNIGHPNPLVVRCRGVLTDRFIFHGHHLGRVRHEIDPCDAFMWGSAPCALARRPARQHQQVCAAVPCETAIL